MGSFGVCGCGVAWCVGQEEDAAQAGVGQKENAAQAGVGQDEDAAQAGVVEEENAARHRCCSSVLMSFQCPVDALALNYYLPG